MKPNIGTVVVLLLVYVAGLCTISMSPDLDGSGPTTTDMFLGVAFAVGFPAAVLLVLRLANRSPDRATPEDEGTPRWPGRDDRQDKD